MCTSFIKKGKDLIFGFNMDLNREALLYDVVTESDCFYVGIKAMMEDETMDTYPKEYFGDENHILRIHGVNSKGNFGVQLNNMNFKKGKFQFGEKYFPLYVLIDQFLKNETDLKEIVKTASEKELVNLPTGAINLPDLAMHSLLADAEGNILLIEPGNGFSIIRENYAVLSNFSVMELPLDLTDETRGYYGKDRYDTALKILQESGDDFNIQDALNLLNQVKQEGTFGTRVSFVYSKNENAVFFTLEGDFQQVKKHVFTS